LFAGGADDGGGESVCGGAEGVGGDGGEVEAAAAGLGVVDFLQSEYVGVEGGDRGGEPVGVYGTVVQASAVQEVECGQAHVPTLMGGGGWRRVWVRGVGCAVHPGVVLFDGGVRAGRRVCVGVAPVAGAVRVRVDHPSHT
jgi:hypothetical protein